MFSLVLGVNDLLGIPLTLGAKAGALPGDGVDAVKAASSAAAANQAIACFHAIHAIARIKQPTPAG